MFRKQRGRCLIFDHRLGGIDRAIYGKVLHARGDVHRLAEIVLPVVEIDRETRALVDADLEQQVLVATLVVQVLHALAHAERRSDGTIGRDERRHDRIADRLDHGTRLLGDDFVQHVEMRADEIIGGEITDALVELGRALEVGEQECQRQDLQALVDFERIGPVEIAEGLVGEQALGGQKRAAAAENARQILARRSRPRQRARVGLIFQRDAQRTGPHLQRRRSAR